MSELLVLEAHWDENGGMCLNQSNFAETLVGRYADKYEREFSTPTSCEKSSGIDDDVSLI